MKVEWSNLPHDILVSVFSLLNLSNIITVDQVCRNWNRAARTNSLWKRLYLHHRGWWHEDQADWRDLFVKAKQFSVWQQRHLASIPRIPRCEECRQMKIVILGCGAVGKSALTIRFEQGIFVEKYDPTIETGYRKTLELDGNYVSLENVDTCGTEQFLAMRDVYIKTGQGFVMVYSVVSRPSLEYLTNLRAQILRVRGVNSVPFLLVGNKKDLEEEREVSTGEGEQLAVDWNCHFLETSAKTGENVEDIWSVLCRAVSQYHHPFHLKRSRRRCRVM